MHLAGELSKVSLPSLMQLVRNGSLTGEITICQGAKTASIFVEQGRLIHAESDSETGRDALLELFLWVTGSFSFTERDVNSISRSFPADEPLERVLRQGVAYLDQKRYLDQLRITGQTVLQRTAAGEEKRAEIPLLSELDGRQPLASILARTGLCHREYVQVVFKVLDEGLAVVADLKEQGHRVDLPGWVIARLRQDNPDLCKAIVDMVIWVDRVKCWMYQADAELGSIVEQLAEPGAADSDQVDRPDQTDTSTSREESNLATKASNQADAPPPDSLEGGPEAEIEDQGADSDYPPGQASGRTSIEF